MVRAEGQIGQGVSELKQSLGICLLPLCTYIEKKDVFVEGTCSFPWSIEGPAGNRTGGHHSIIFVDGQLI